MEVGYTHQQAFESIKKSFLTCVTLEQPNINKPYYLRCDASGVTVAAILSQFNSKGEEMIIETTSRSLNNAERKYSTTEKELLAIVNAVRKWRHYLLGSQIKVKTDHRALIFLNKGTGLNARIVRWAIAIGEFDLQIEYVMGRENTAADFLSRLRRANEVINEDKFFLGSVKEKKERIKAQKEGTCRNANEEKEVNRKGKMMALTERGVKGRQIVRRLAEEQRADKKWGRIMQEMERRTSIMQGKQRYCLHAGLLFLEKREARNKWVLCVPEAEVENILKEFHDGKLHPGIDKMQKMFGNLVLWAGMTKDIRKYVRSCHVCQINKSKSVVFAGPWQAIIPKEVGDLVAVDLLGPLVQSVYGYTGVLLIVDVFSKFVKLYGLRKATSTTCINKIRSYIKQYGTPKRLLSDNGSQFSSHKWKKGLLELGIRELHTAIRNPKGNPSERYIKVVGECLRIACHGKHSTWAHYLEQVEDYINHSYNGSTENLSIELQFKRPCILRWSNGFIIRQEEKRWIGRG